MNITKILISLSLLFILSNGIGIVLGKVVTASECSHDEEHGLVARGIDVFLGSNAHACTNTVYMGGKWSSNVAYVRFDAVDSATIRDYVQNSITHFNNMQSHVRLYSNSYLSKGDPVIYVEDKAMSAEYDWTGKAYNSWQGGWPIDTLYNSVGGVNIVINTNTFWDGTTQQEQNTLYHEIGHSLGMGHRSDINTLMYCSRSRTAFGLTDSDISVLNVIY
ncbi:matrixin family metalloprotease [Sutcliffiella horikoshii]|uniref:matrixin family metalloprotease n=1 Tax=Sutcliffiella horikoshii TaxID=79883 RepID=UPI003CFB16D4